MSFDQADSVASLLYCGLQAGSPMFWTQTAARLRWEYYWPASAGKRFPSFNKETAHHLTQAYKLHRFCCKLPWMAGPTSEENIKQLDSE